MEHVLVDTMDGYSVVTTVDLMVGETVDWWVGMTVVLWAGRMVDW